MVCIVFQPSVTHPWCLYFQVPHSRRISLLHVRLHCCSPSNNSIFRTLSVTPFFETAVKITLRIPEVCYFTIPCVRWYSEFSRIFTAVSHYAPWFISAYRVEFLHVSPNLEAFSVSQSTSECAFFGVWHIVRGRRRFLNLKVVVFSRVSTDEIYSCLISIISSACNHWHSLKRYANCFIAPVHEVSGGYWLGMLAVVRMWINPWIAKN